MSNSPDCRAGRRCCGEEEVNWTLSGEPNTVIDMARPISTKKPFQLPLLSTEKKPGEVPTPTLMTPRCLMASSVAPACAEEAMESAAAAATTPPARRRRKIVSMRNSPFLSDLFAYPGRILGSSAGGCAPESGERMTPVHPASRDRSHIDPFPLGIRIFNAEGKQKYSRSIFSAGRHDETQEFGSFMHRRGCGIAQTARNTSEFAFNRRQIHYITNARQI